MSTTITTASPAQRCAMLIGCVELNENTIKEQSDRNVLLINACQNISNKLTNNVHSCTVIDSGVAIYDAINKCGIQRDAQVKQSQQVLNACIIEASQSVHARRLYALIKRRD
jgi:hypothetical protein